MNTETKQEERDGQGRCPIRGVLKQSIDVIGKGRNILENGSASPIMEINGSNPNRWAWLKSGGPWLELVSSQKDDAVGGPFRGPVRDLSSGRRGLSEEGVRQPLRWADLGVDL
jgi:hypothetical protein